MVVKKYIKNRRNMALVKCKECNKEVSNQAKNCPNCGAKIKKPIGILGWIGIIFLVMFMFSFVSVLSKTSSSTQQSTNQEALSEKGQSIKTKHPDWPNDVCNTVAGRKIFIGMTKEQVIAAWGRPYKINTTLTSNVRHEQWVMSDSLDSSYLYFDDEILRSIQQSK